MVARSISALVIVMVSTVACGASPDIADEDSTSEDSTSTASQAIWGQQDELQSPLERLRKAPDLPEIPPRRPTGIPFIDELQQRRALRPCATYYATLYEPVHKRPIQIPITVCP